MIRRVLHLTLVLAAAAAFLAPPALAGASKPKKHHKGIGNCVSAVCVYTDAGGPDGGKGKPLSTQAAAELKRLGGKDARDLLAIGVSRGLGIARATSGEAAAVGKVTAPGALLAALDLGAGPIALFVTLLGGAGAFALGRALRRRRNAA